jgi:type IV secretory pathway VirB10-like protein
MADRDDDLDGLWRRRVIMLAGGLVILGLLAWALSGTASRTTAAAQQSAVAEVRAANGLPSVAYGTVPPTQPASLAGSPSAPASPTGSPKASKSPKDHSPKRQSAKVKPQKGKSPKAASSSKATAKAGKRVHLQADSTCQAGSVVMTLFSVRPSYSAGEPPEFDVYAVSTSASGCEFRFGPGAVRVLVSQHGRTVWDSAACHPAAVQQERLVRGVPVQMSVIWNRNAAYGCRGWLPPRSAGRFTAVARTATQSTPATTFELAR